MSTRPTVGQRLTLALPASPVALPEPEWASRGAEVWTAYTCTVCGARRRTYAAFLTHRERCRHQSGRARVAS